MIVLIILMKVCFHIRNNVFVMKRFVFKNLVIDILEVAPTAPQTP